MIFPAQAVALLWLCAPASLYPRAQKHKQYKEPFKTCAQAAHSERDHTFQIQISVKPPSSSYGTVRSRRTLEIAFFPGFRKPQKPSGQSCEV